MPRCRRPIASWFPNDPRAAWVRKRVLVMSNAALYARVSSARQKEADTIASQTAALRGHAAGLGLHVPEQWVFEDDGYSGARLIRPALERLRDLVCQVPVDVLLVHAPDRLARKYAYQAPAPGLPSRSATCSRPSARPVKLRTTAVVA